MSGKGSRSEPAVPAPPAPSDEQVVAFLRARPDFLQTHADLIDVLALPAEFKGRNVVDLRQAMMDRLQDELQRLRDHRGQLLANARANQSAQSQTHRAVLAMLEAPNFEHLIHIVTRDLPQILAVDAVTLCVEVNGPDTLGQPATPGVRRLERGAVDALMGPGEDLLLIDAAPQTRDVFGAAADLVRSQALVRLHTSHTAPAGLLAIGSRERTRFHAGQGTELLNFLARTLERLIRAWLGLPA